MPVPPKLKDRYEIKDMLGQGGMGLVFRAYDAVVKRDVALKTLKDIPHPAALQFFYKECDVLASMSHPNIVEIFDVGEYYDEGETKPFFVMPLLNGVTLDKLIRSSSQRLTVERAVDIFVQTCRGLQAAHERNLVHRDLKPSNIFVMEDDSVKIIDFGVAHMTGAHTSTGQKGTLLYMAPEQIELKPPSSLSDIFALGVVCYETLTRVRPFERSMPGETAQAIMHHIPPAASELNPTVNQALGRVVHKAMAKQAWHRFSSAREFADAIQKAMRNESIDSFDPARFQPRVERAQRAFDKGDFAFASEILSELEAEGYIDQTMSALRRQIDQASRKKTLAHLLETARSRLEEDEYPLALQKVQEVLQIDPDNTEAVGLRSTIENRRTERKIDDWFRLVRQHTDNHAYGHAREALQNLLQLRPKDARARQLLAEIDRQEQEYLRVRQDKERLYRAAQEAWQNGAVSTALGRLEEVLELDRRAPDSSAPDRGAAYQSFYNQVRSEQDNIKNAYSEARKNLQDRNFARALAICDDLLTRHPQQALFQALRYDVEEQQRQQLSACIAETDRRVQEEPDIDRRVAILKEAQNAFPGEAHFEKSFRLMRDKRDLVHSIVAKARLHEERGQFGDALGQWEILRNIYAQYPGLAVEIDRLVKRRDQQSRAESKARWVEQIDRHLEATEYSRAAEAARRAIEEFQDDPELKEMEKLARQGLDRVAEAERLLADGKEECSARRFDQGVTLLRQAWELDQRNPVVRLALLDTLVEQARVALETDWRAAETLLQQALELDSAYAPARSLRTLVHDRKREERIDQCVAEARQLQSAGDVAGALAAVEKGLAAFPREPRLLQLQSTLNKSFYGMQHSASTQTAQAGTPIAPPPPRFATPSTPSRTPVIPPAAPPHALPANAMLATPVPDVSGDAETILASQLFSPQSVSAGAAAATARAVSAPPPDTSTPDTPALDPATPEPAPELATAVTPSSVPTEATMVAAPAAATPASVTAAASPAATGAPKAHAAAPAAATPAAVTAAASPAATGAPKARAAAAGTPASVTAAASPAVTGAPKARTATPKSGSKKAGLISAAAVILLLAGGVAFWIRNRTVAPPPVTTAPPAAAPTPVVTPEPPPVIAETPAETPPATPDPATASPAKSVRPTTPGRPVGPMAPQPATLVLRGALPGAQVTLDREPAGTVQADGTLTLQNIAPGEHSIEIRKEQYRPRRIQRLFNSGESAQLTAADLALERAMGTLRLHLTPADARVTIQRAGDTEARVLTEFNLNLPEGSYTLTARAPKHTDRSATIQITDGQTVPLDLALVREKEAAPVARSVIADWEIPGSWAREGDWFVRRGGNHAWSRVSPISGLFTFTASLRKGRRLQWAISGSSDKDYSLFQMDKKFFYRNEVKGGKDKELAKVPHNLKKTDYYTVQVEIAAGSVIHRIHDGEKWIALDGWSAPGNNFASGKFGFYIPGSDQVALSHLTFLPVK